MNSLLELIELTRDVAKPSTLGGGGGGVSSVLTRILTKSYQFFPKILSTGGGRGWGEVKKNSALT